MVVDQHRSGEPGTRPEGEVACTLVGGASDPWGRWDTWLGAQSCQRQARRQRNGTNHLGAYEDRAWAA